MPDPQPRVVQGKKVAGIDRKWWLIGGGSVALIVAYSYHKSKVAAQAAAATTNATDPTIDPATGVPYADEYSNLAGINANPASYLGGFGGFSTTPLGPPTTNVDWMRSAIAALTGSGYTTAAATTALTEYLLGVPLTTDQLTAVETAVSLVGPPPTPVPVSHIPNQGQSQPPISTGGGSSSGSGGSVPSIFDIGGTTTTTTPPPTTATGINIRGNDVFYGDLFLGPKGIPIWSTAQINALGAAANTKVYNHDYTLNNNTAIPDSYKNGKVY